MSVRYTLSRLPFFLPVTLLFSDFNARLCKATKSTFHLFLPCLCAGRGKRSRYCIRYLFGWIIACLYLHNIPAQAQPNSQQLPSHTLKGGPACATVDVWQQTVDAHPDLQVKQNQIEQQMLQILDRTQGSYHIFQSQDASALYTIPVVVHIVHDPADATPGTGSNISDTRVFAGIQHLNDGFRNVGAYDSTTGVDVQIEFCLAKVDTAGNATSGITRSSSVLTNVMPSMAELQNLSSPIYWDTYEYFNIYVVNSLIGSTAGISFRPSVHGKFWDGIVVEHQYFGTSAENSSVTIHEAGHWLGLYHTFHKGCVNNNCLTDGDKVCDTPPDGSTTLSPLSPPCTNFNSCTTDEDDPSINNPFRSPMLGGLGDQDDHLNNYMDYNRLACSNAFTPGQKDRMMVTLTNTRSSLLTIDGCQDTCSTVVVPAFTASAHSVFVDDNVSFTNFSAGANQYEWFVNGDLWSSATDPNYTFNARGQYIITLLGHNNNPFCSRQITDTIWVTCAATASFNPDAINIVLGQTVNFTNTSTGATSYEWQVDGASLATSTHFSHAFDSLGGSMVTLIANNGICKDTAYQLITTGICNPSVKENIWYFGSQAGLDFSGGAPVILTNGLLTAEEPSAVMVNDKGNLLFYTDGDNVWDRTHTLMPGGTGLSGSSGSVHTIITPMPDDPEKFYIFSIRPDHLLKYAIVDTALNGGLGDVSVKNIGMGGATQYGDKLAATWDCNFRNIWLITQERFSANINAWLITPAGISPPVQSAVGPPVFENEDAQLKLSHDAGRLASVKNAFGTANDEINLFYFDKITGKASYDLTIPLPNDPYSVEFSLDGKVLYAGYADKVFQYDLMAGTEADIVASQVEVSTGAGNFHAMQMGPNGKLYIARDNQDYLSVIHNPSVLGMACSFTFDGIYLDGKTGQKGLPTFMQRNVISGSIIGEIYGADTVCAYTTMVPYKFTNIECAQDNVTQWDVIGEATLDSLTDYATWLSFGDAGKDTLLIQKQTYCNGMVQDTFIITVMPLPVVDLGPDTGICVGATVTFDAGGSYDDYLWQDGSTASSLIAGSSGEYWVKVTDSINQLACTNTDTVSVNDIRAGDLDLGNDTSICFGDILILDAQAGFREYEWQDGSPDQTYTVYLPGTYWVTITDVCGDTRTDSIKIDTLPSPDVSITADTLICYGDSLPLQATVSEPGNYTYTWTPITALSNPLIANPVASPAETTTYTVEVTNDVSCQQERSVTVSVAKYNQEVSAAILYGDPDSICVGDTVHLSAQLTVVNSCDLTTADCPLLPSAYIHNPTGSYSDIGLSYGGSSRFKRQHIYLASELTALGMVAGDKISGLVFSITDPADVGSPIPGVNIYMGCTNKSSWPSSPYWKNVIGGSKLVKGSFTFTPVQGDNTITFDNAFVWDGISNLTLGFCSSASNGTVTKIDGVVTAGVNRTLKVTFGSGPSCGATLTGNLTHSDKFPSTKFIFCSTGNPVNQVDYTWTPGVDISDPNIDSPKVYPKESTTYYVTAMADSTCPVGTDSIPIFVNSVKIEALGDCDANDWLSLNANVTGTPLPSTCEYTLELFHYGMNCGWAGAMVEVQVNGMSIGWYDVCCCNWSQSYQIPVAHGDQIELVYWEDFMTDWDNEVILYDPNGVDVYSSGYGVFGGSLWLGTADCGGGGGFTYSWTPASSLSDPTIANPQAHLPNDTSITYVVNVGNGVCAMTDTLSVSCNNCQDTDGPYILEASIMDTTIYQSDSTFHLVLSEPIDCASLAAGDFELDGTGSTTNTACQANSIIGATGVNCQSWKNGIDTSRRIAIELNHPVPGNYKNDWRVKAISGITQTVDTCENPLDGQALNAGAPVILPIELLDFKVQGYHDQTVLISWTVATEEHGIVYELERSVTGDQLTTIHQRPGEGSGSTYHYQDRDPWKGDNLYRLKLTDNKEEVSYSPWEYVYIAVHEESDNLLIYPNPSAGTIHVNYFTSSKNKMHIKLFDITGGFVKEYVFDTRPGEQVIDLDLRWLSPGLYFLKAGNGRKVWHEKLEILSR